jgi:hypothetical protein
MLLDQVEGLVFQVVDPPVQVAQKELDVLAEAGAQGLPIAVGMKAVGLLGEDKLELGDPSGQGLPLHYLLRWGLPGLKGHALQEGQDDLGIEGVGLGPLAQRPGKALIARGLTTITLVWGDPGSFQAELGLRPFLGGPGAQLSRPCRGMVKGAGALWVAVVSAHRAQGRGAHIDTEAIALVHGNPPGYIVGAGFPPLILACRACGYRLTVLDTPR